MNKNKKIMLSFGLLIIIALSCVLFFGVGDASKNIIQILSFIFVIIDELVTYSVILWLTSNKNNAFSIAGISSATCIFLVISIIANVLISKTLRGILVFNFSILLIYIFIITLIKLADKEEK